MSFHVFNKKQGVSEKINEIIEKLSIIGVNAKRSYNETNILIEKCIFCQNPNWNLEIEASEKFVFHCWACSASGTAHHLLNKILRLYIDVPILSRKDQIKTTREFLRHETIEKFNKISSRPEKIPRIKDENLRQIAEKAIKDHNWKYLSYPHAFRHKKISLTNALICQGILKRGLLIISTREKYTFKTKQDLFLYNVNHSRELIIVEGPYDIYPHFIENTVLILTQTNLSYRFLEILFDYLPHKKEIHLCLDRDAEEPLVHRLKRLPHSAWLNIYTFVPEKHSPRESQYLLAKSIF